jgi:hypothetical protein
MAFNGVCFKCDKTGHKANNCHQKMPVACPTNLWQEVRVAIPTRTCNAMDVVRLVTSQRTAGKRNPMHTSNHQDGNHPKKLEL